MELYIVRHGETHWNKGKRLQGNLDIELNENGIQAARELADKLKDVPFDCIYHSPLVRAQKTAECLLKYQNCPLIADVRLQEMNFGVMQGKSFDEWFDQGKGYGSILKSDPVNYKAPQGGESIGELKKRAASFVKEVLENSKDNRVMIVAHGMLNQALVNVLEEREDKDFWQSALQKNCEATVYEFKDKKWKRKV